MGSGMDWKALFVVISIVVEIYAFYPYLRDIFLRRTRPHAYSWLIWTLTQGIAFAAAWYGGGRWGAANLAAGTMLMTIIFVLSLRYGTMNIRPVDTLSFIAALFALGAWFVLRNAAAAVLIGTAIDLIGYIPTLRKTYEEPWSETVLPWVLWCIANTFAMLALGEYNVLTLTYLLAITLANLALIAVCVVRRSLLANLTG